MLLTISFKLLNNEYSESLAKDLEFDKESISNPKYKLESSFPIKNEIDEIIIKDKQSLSIELESRSGDKKLFFMDNMTQIQCIKDDEVLHEFAISEDLIHNTHQVKKENSKRTYQYFYLKDREDFTIIKRSIYILEKDLKRIT